MRATAGAAIAVVALGLATAACGSSTPTTTTTTASVPETTASAPGLAVESSAYGSILATSSGRTLYEHSSDPTDKSTCTGSCATAWPPFTVSAVPSFGAGVNAALVGHVGTTGQLTYGGHALYTFVRDTAAGQTNGEGINAFGGSWYVLSASTGKPVTKKVPGSTASTLPGGS